MSQFKANLNHISQFQANLPLLCASSELTYHSHEPVQVTNHSYEQVHVTYYSYEPVQFKVDFINTTFMNQFRGEFPL